MGQYLPHFQCLDLDAHRDNIGVTRAGATGSGAFNVWGNSLPAEQVPRAGRTEVEGVPFEFPPTGGGRPDNVRCAGQHLRVRPGGYDWLYLVAAAERRAEEEIACHYADGSVDFEPLRLSDFWAAPAAFGESAAVSTTSMHYPFHVQRDVPGRLWCQRVPLVRRAPLAGLTLPRNPAVHVFAATLLALTGAAR